MLTNLIYPLKRSFAPCSPHKLRHGCVIVQIFSQDNYALFFQEPEPRKNPEHEPESSKILNVSPLFLCLSSFIFYLASLIKCLTSTHNFNAVDICIPHEIKKCAKSFLAACQINWTKLIIHVCF